MPRGCCAIRGRAMQSAVPAGEGAMSALIGVEIEAAEAACKEAAATGLVGRRQ